MLNKKMAGGVAATALGMLLSAHAGAVDLHTWTAQGGTSIWSVQTNDTVLQTYNGAPTVFFDSTVTSTQGTALSGKIKVTTTSDDDFIGFVLGYDNGEIFSNSADYYLVDWKQNNQGGGALAGMAISHVTDGTTENDFWNHGTATGTGVNEIARATHLGSTGWSDNTEYAFNINFTSSLIEVKVDNVLELSITPTDAGVSSFDDGSFGFYNYSQGGVLYSAIQQTDCDVTPNAPECQTGGGPTVPEPSVMALLGLGLAGMGLGGYRRRKVTA